jgi:hypothetical protein
LAPFLLNTFSHNYWRSDRDNLTFLQSPQFFINTLFGLDEVFDIDNNMIFINKKIFDLKIKIDLLENGNYTMKLVLDR